MDTSLMPHAHPHCHVILKASGPDQLFTVADEAYPVREDTAVLVNAWEQHRYRHCRHDVPTLFLARYTERSWLKRPTVPLCSAKARRSSRSRASPSPTKFAGYAVGSSTRSSRGPATIRRRWKS